jgi:hypothetical protein
MGQLCTRGGQAGPEACQWHRLPHQRSEANLQRIPIWSLQKKKKKHKAGTTLISTAAQLNSNFPFVFGTETNPVIWPYKSFFGDVGRKMERWGVRVAGLPAEQDWEEQAKL